MIQIALTPLEPSSTGNRLLDCLSIAERERLLAASRHGPLKVGERLYSRGEIPRFCHFPTAGLISVVFTSEKGSTVELETIGNEGMAGWPFLLANQPASNDCMVQGGGEGFRIPLAELVTEFAKGGQFQQRVLELTHHQVTLCNQLEACNRLHRAEARFVRWLLMVQDRVHSDELAITQEFLSNMLGTRRTTVTEVSGILERAGAIEARRGLVKIINREALEKRACECYGILLGRFRTLYNTPKIENRFPPS